MKTFVPFKQSVLKFVMFVLVSASGVHSQAQTSTVLKFENGSLQSGPSAGTNGAVYLFPLVNTTTDALIKITGRSSASVTLTDIDLDNTGYPKAFQPQVKYGSGSVNSASSWWMEFEIKFVTKNTTTSVTLPNAYATGLDLDGDDGSLKEFNTFYGSNSYTTESNSKLNISNVTGTLLQLLSAGKKFTGVTTDHHGIDTLATDLMTTNVYLNVNTITIRVGASTNGPSNNTDRMHSIWFKNFTYNAPLSTLPVKLVSFTAALNNNKADLKWATAGEMNVSHFEIERSTDGTNYSQAAIIFAYGNTTEDKTYALSNDVSNVQTTLVYYRLRSVDIDGKSQLSEVRIIRIGKKNEMLSMVTYPNPVNSELRITVPSGWQNKEVVMGIFNLNGQVVKTLKISNASQTETIAVNDLAKGFYIVKANCGTEVAQQKIIKN